MILFKIIPYHSLLGLDSAMRSLIISALFSLAVVGCSTEPVDTTPSSWELQATKDAERNQRRRESVAKKKRDAEQEIARAETAKLERLVWEAQAPEREKVKRDIARLKNTGCVHLYQLLSFKDTDDFKFMGFGTAGPYNKWEVSMRALRGSTAKGLITPIPLELRVAVADIHVLGVGLIFDPWDDRDRRKLAEVKEVSKCRSAVDQNPYQ